MQSDDEKVSAWIDEALDHTGWSGIRNKIKHAWNPRLRSSFGRVVTPGTRIELSTKMWKVTSAKQKREVVIHESCHVIEIFQTGKTDHGEMWTELMQQCGFKNPNPTHEILDFVRRHELRCGCSIHVLSTVLYNRIKNGSHEYACKKCGGVIST
jgi:predicted SprT family Zn-dependent metalloprotease